MSIAELTAKALASRSGGWLKRRGRAPLLIFCVAFVLRALFVVWLNYAPSAQGLSVRGYANDSFVYDALARSLASGQGYQVDGDYYWPSSYPPLFPLFLAGLHLLSGGRPPSILLIGLVNALFSALTALLLYSLVQLSFTPQAKEGLDKGSARAVAFVAAMIFAVYPFSIFNTAFVLKESFAVFLTVGFALVWIRMLCAEDKKSLWWAAFAGAMCGLCVLSRFPHLGLIVLFVVVNLWLSGRRGRWLLRETVLALAVFALVLAPWLVRNYYVLGHLALSSHGPSRYLYNANSELAEPESNGYYEAHGSGRAEHNRAVEAATKDDLYAKESTYLRHAIRAFVRSPGHVALLVGAKLVSMWRPVWAGSSLRTWLVLGVPYLLMMALALPGLWLARRRITRARLYIIVPYAFIIFYLLGHALFYGMIRERQYVEPFLIMFAGYSLCLMPTVARND